MRNALLVLLLLNFLAYTYQAWIIEPDEQVDAYFISQDYPGLVIAEVARPQAQPAPPPPAQSSPAPSPPPEPVVAARCLRIGPFAREADADSVRAGLEDGGASVRQTAEAGQVWVGHWVQVPDQGSRGAAEQARKALRAAGMADAYVLPGEGNRISLGVFRLRSSANQVVEQAKRAGYATQVADRFQPGTNFWLQVRIPGNATADLANLRTTSGQILRTETLACDAAGFGA